MSRSTAIIAAAVAKVTVLGAMEPDIWHVISAAEPAKWTWLAAIAMEEMFIVHHATGPEEPMSDAIIAAEAVQQLVWVAAEAVQQLVLIAAAEALYIDFLRTEM